MAGTQTVESNLTIPANVALSFAHGNVVNVNSGVVLWINGPISADWRQQIFGGSGNVLLHGRAAGPVCPIWWNGSIGDGVTEASAAIQKAIRSGGTTYLPSNPLYVGQTSGDLGMAGTDAGGNGQRRIYLPTGRYVIGTTINLPSGVTIEGDGPSSQLVLAAGFKGPIFELEFTEPDGQPSKTRVLFTKLKNLGLNGNSVAESIGVRGWNIYNYGIYDFLMEEVGVLSFQTYGVYIKAPQRVTVKGCNFEYNQGVALRLHAMGDGIGPVRVVDNKFFSNDVGIEFWYMTSPIVEGNIIENNSYCGLLAHGNKMANYINNYFENNGWTADSNGTGIGHDIKIDLTTCDFSQWHTGGAISGSLGTLIDSNVNFSSQTITTKHKVRNLTNGGLWNITALVGATGLAIERTSTHIASNFDWATGDPYVIEARQATTTSAGSTTLTDTTANFANGSGGFDTNSKVWDLDTGAVYNITGITSGTLLAITLHEPGRNGERSMANGANYVTGYPNLDTMMVGNLHADNVSGQLNDWNAILLDGDYHTVLTNTGKHSVVDSTSRVRANFGKSLYPTFRDVHPWKISDVTHTGAHFSAQGGVNIKGRRAVDNTQGGEMTRIMALAHGSAKTILPLESGTQWAGMIEYTAVAENDDNRYCYYLSRYAHDLTFTTIASSTQNLTGTLSASGSNIQLMLNGAAGQNYRAVVRIAGARSYGTSGTLSPSDP